MQSKKSAFLVIGTTAFVIFALFFVFWLSSRHSGPKPDIQVPSPSHTEPSAPPNLALLNDPEEYMVFDLRAENVGQILAALKTPDAYSLTLLSSVYAGGQKADTQVSLFFLDGLTRLSLADSRPQRELLLTDSHVYSWTADRPTVTKLPLGSFDAVRSAKMPDLQMLIACPVDRIDSAEFVEYGRLWTIRVRYTNDFGQTECSYVAIDSGLITHNEVYEDGVLVLEMTVTALSFSEPEPSIFYLPDGSTPE
ncbi:MAG: hypothetical protein IJC93_11315 [Clostridia bacterium]|nr:hypothetical protein [Clostridia bacterium]